MTMKCTSVTLTSSNLHYRFLYYFWRHMTTYGWQSIGESNGTVGGMGITGLYSSYNDLNNANAWYVLRSPDFQRQILLSNEGLSAIGYRYSRSAGYTGGGPTTKPSATDEFVLQSSTDPAGSSSYVWYIAMDTSYPYGWYAINSASSKMMSMIPIQVLQDSDEDPYVYHWLNTSDHWLVKCWHPDNVTQTEITEKASIGRVWPSTNSTAWQGSPPDRNGKPLILPSIWFSRPGINDFFKGFSAFQQSTGYQNVVLANWFVFNSTGENMLMHHNNAIWPWNWE